MSFYTVIGGCTLGFATYSIKFSSAVIASSNSDSRFSDQPWRRNPYSIILENAKSFGYKISQKVYGPSGNSKWNEKNINYAVISLFNTDTVPLINTFIGSHLCKYEVDPITYVFHEKGMKWHSVESVLPNCKDIVFWRLPAWNYQTHSAEEYIKQFALPLYNGIILVTNTRLRMIDTLLYKEIYDSIQRLVPNVVYGKPDIHIRIYIVRTEFDYDLRIKLTEIVDRKLKNICNKNWIDWMIPQSILTQKEFMECVEDTIEEIKDETVRKLDSVFYDNYWRIKRELNEKLFIVPTEWDNRMIATSGHNGCNGYLSLLYWMKICGNQHKWNKLLVCHNGNTYDSELYRYYTTTEWKSRHYILSSMLTTVTAVAIFFCGKFMYDGCHTGYIGETTK